jgi:hypothetical protein
MATLGQVGELVTTRLRERVEELVSAVQDDSTDFGEVSRLADAVGELTDTVAEIYTDLEQTLMRGLQQGGAQEQEEQREEPRSEQRGQQSDDSNGSAGDEVTKEELLERAREVNIHGRSSMTKEELAQAVEAEEAVTKEELLERAREAGIEGRSSMTKDELRDALREAGV